MKTKNDPLAWTIQSRTQGHDYRIFQTRSHVATRQDSSEAREFTVIDTDDWVNIIALTKTADVVLVRQFRHGTEKITLEIPGGAVDQGETHKEAAKRELREETGYESENWEHIGNVDPNPALLSNRCSTWLARDAKPSATPDPDPGEVIEVTCKPLHKIPELIGQSTISHALVVAAFYHLLRRNDGQWNLPTDNK